MPGFKHLPPLEKLSSLGVMHSIHHHGNRHALYWIGLNILMAGCVCATFISHVGLEKRETRYANQSGQRATIDPVSGAVSLYMPSQKRTPAFDVSEKKPVAPEHDAPAEHAAEESTSPAHPPANADGLPSLRTEPLAAPAATEGEPLVVAPAPEITETVDGLSLPKRNGESNPSTIYAERFPRTPEHHLLTFVVMDAGISSQSLPLIAALPREVTTAFSPYATHARESIAALRSKGREVWAMIPTVTARYPQEDPGPLGLITTQPKDELLHRLRTTLSNTLGSAGVVFPPDEALSKRSESLSLVLAELDARGLNVLSTHPTQSLSGTKSGNAAMLRRADVILDSEPDADAIAKKLAAIPAALEESDHLVVMLSARPQSLQAVAEWLKSKPYKEPIVLAPLSAQWLPKEAPAPAPAEESGGHGGGHGGGEKKEEKKSSGGHH